MSTQSHGHRPLVCSQHPCLLFFLVSGKSLPLRALLLSPCSGSSVSWYNAFTQTLSRVFHDTIRIKSHIVNVKKLDISTSGYITEDALSREWGEGMGTKPLWMAWWIILIISLIRLRNACCDDVAGKGTKPDVTKPTWKERTDSYKLSSVLQMHTLAWTSIQAHR